jgi:ATP-dependent helicase/DNAse subunit B
MDIWVTDLTTALWFPFQYFAERSLALEPLPVQPDGISAKDRGRIVHKILKEFVSCLSDGVQGWPDEISAAWALLQRTTEEKLGPYQERSEWRAEKRWLLGVGDAGKLGVLRVWLEAEQLHWLDGWRPVKASLETVFDKLSIGGASVSITGKVDRIDEHKTLGRWVIDYKTGSLPGKGELFIHFLEPQLPAYCSAAIKGMSGEAASQGWVGQITAGYASLQKVGEVKIEPFVMIRPRKKQIDRTFIAEWEALVSERLVELSAGSFPARPGPDPKKATRGKKPCEYCEMQALCCFYDEPEKALVDSEEEGGA